MEFTFNEQKLINSFHFDITLGILACNAKLMNTLGLSVFCVLGVIAFVIFVIVGALAGMGRFICSRKETYRNQDVKAHSEDVHEFPFSSPTDLQNTPSQNRKHFV